jgi:dephospho-CoA kinase
VTARRGARPRRIGLTGPIGCGKSTVARWLAERPGVVVIDADRVARDVLAAGTPQTDAVYERFGEELRNPGGEPDRAALGRIVFSDPAALRDLEAIVHPAVRPRILTEVDAADAAGAVAVIIEAIKLVEGGLADLCDEVWLVTCAPEVQLERLVGRGSGWGDARDRIAAQGDLATRLRPAATHVVDTGDEPAATRSRVLEQLDAVLAVP